MKKLLSLVLGSTALMGVSVMGTVQAADFEAGPVYAYAATGFVGGGGSWESVNNCQGGNCDHDIATIVGGGDIVLPLRGYWNVQLSGAVHTDHSHPFRSSEESQTQFQGSAIGFWRDPAMGVFGIEVGAYSPFGNNR